MNPMVSVYCLAYNHEKYIRDALDGFVSQKTNFPYEVYVHDDASTDDTAGIIREYAEKYPDIIHPIFQTENQYSKHIIISETFIFPNLKGKYIACCEGDDYWCDENKLQRQVDWLEAHPEYSFCVHNTKVIDFQDGSERIYNPNTEDIDIPLTGILQMQKTTIHTSSYMFRADFLYMPEGFHIDHVGDFPRAVYMALCGKVRFLHQIMSVYRRNVDGSWTKRINAAPYSVQIARVNQVIQFLHRVDEYTEGKYKEYIAGLIHQRIFKFLMQTGDLKTIKKDYDDLYNNLPYLDKIKLHIKYYFPGLVKVYLKIKKG